MWEMFSIKDSFRSKSFPQISGIESIVEHICCAASNFAIGSSPLFKKGTLANNGIPGRTFYPPGGFE